MFRQKDVLMTTPRLVLRLPHRKDYGQWHELRLKNESFLRAWEPRRQDDPHSERQFLERVKWSQKSFQSKRAIAVLIELKDDRELIGAITLDNVRYGPAQAASIGYWLGFEYTKQGYMREAVARMVSYGFNDLDLSRIEAAVLEANAPSRKLLESSGFRYEGLARNYLQIDGRWRNHLLYANLRKDRMGATEQGRE